MQHPRRIAFINEKGGSAKTTLVANLGAYLALRRGRRVLAIDMDPQGQLAKVFGVSHRAPTRSAIDLLLDTVLGAPDPDGATSPQVGSTLPTVRTRIDGLDLIVANKSLGLFSAWEDADGDPTGRLAATLDRALQIERYDFVFFDAPPSFGALTLNILRAADEVVVPVPLTYLALDGCAELMRTIETVRERYGHPLRVTMVVPTFYRRTKLAHDLLARLEVRFPKELSHSVLGYHVRIDEAQSKGLSIFEFAPRDRGARALAELAEELELRAPHGVTETA